MRHFTRRQIQLLSASLFSLALATHAFADDGTTRLNALERQIQALQSELHHLRQDMAQHRRDLSALQAQSSQAASSYDHRTMLQTMPNIPPGYALVRAAPGSAPGSVELEQVQMPEPTEPKLPLGSFRVGGVTVTLGGFIESAGIWRSRNETADVGSNFNTGIPLPNSPNYYNNEFRFSARQSRISGMVQAHPDSVTTLTAYAEADFLGAAPTANSNESNSYNLRLRHAYAVYDRSDWDLYFLGGQDWSLLTQSKVGMPYLQPQMNIPLTIDAQYVPGFVWARQPGFRVIKYFDNKLFGLAASLESPQTVFYTGPNGLAPSSLGTITITNPGGSLFSPTNNYSNDIAPDIIVKGTFDPAVAHFEAYGVMRLMRDRVSSLDAGRSETATAGGGGGGAVVHLVPKYVDLQASVLAGEGVGRYGSAQLPDAVVGANGQVVPLPEVIALAGIVAHPTPDLQAYGYVGTEQVSARYFSADVKGKLEGFGYGSPLYSNTTCDEELGSSSGCVGNTSGIVQGTVGTWWDFEHGDYGTMRVGAQYSYTHRSVFQGLGPTPKTDENIVMVSFRYYPFQ